MNNFYPVVKFFGYPNGRDEYVFLGREGQIELKGYPSDKLDSMLRLMNGHSTIDEIWIKLGKGVPLDELRAVVEHLESSGIIADSRKLYEQFHLDSKNPGEFVRDISAEELSSIREREPFSYRGGEKKDLPRCEDGISPILKYRKSERDFSGDEISLKQLSGLLYSMYGGTAGHRSVPSAGGLYPLRLTVQVLAGVKGLQTGGIYHYFPSLEQLEFQSTLDPSALFLPFDSVSLCSDASVVVFVVADLHYLSLKYANRGYRYLLLEAGHMCQNGYLYSAKEGLASIEIGGYKDEMLARKLQLNYPAEAVVSTLFVGKAGKCREEISQIKVDSICEEILASNSSQSINLTGISLVPFSEHITGSECEYEIGGKLEHSFATGRTSYEAKLKALMEAYERICCSNLRWDVVSAAEDLDEQWIDPRKYFPLRPKQCESFTPLEDCQEIEWIRGRSLSGGKEILVPIDMVYYRFEETLKRKRVYVADSSGVAAHFSFDEAVQTAILELVERDALMVYWYGDRGATRIERADISNPTKDRLDQWKNFDINAELFDITLDSVPVVLAIIHSKHHVPYFVAGAAAASDYASAMMKALAEAELMWVSWSKQKISKISPKEVKEPKDHGLLYMQKSYERRIGSLLQSGTQGLRRGVNSDFEALFDPIVISLDDGRGLSGVKVVRVLSEMLLPINFGFGTEAYSHPRFKKLGIKCKRRFPAQPHFFS